MGKGSFRLGKGADTDSRQEGEQHIAVKEEIDDGKQHIAVKEEVDDPRIHIMFDPRIHLERSQEESSADESDSSNDSSGESTDGDYERLILECPDLTASVESERKEKERRHMEKTNEEKGTIRTDIISDGME